MLTNTLLGLVIGVILALTGAGGGILAVPALVFGAHQSVAQAGPVGLLAVGMAAALGAVLGLRAGTVRYRAALLISAVGMALSPLGLWLAQRIENRRLTLVFALVLLFVAYRTYRRPTRRHPPLAMPQRTLPHAYAMQTRAASSGQRRARVRWPCPAAWLAFCRAFLAWAAAS